MVFEKLQIVEKKLDQLLSRDVEHSIEEVSLHKASKLLHRNRFVLIEAVENGLLTARKYIHNNQIRYRFRIADLYKYQQQTKYTPGQPVDLCGSAVPAVADIINHFNESYRKEAR